MAANPDTSSTLSGSAAPGLSDKVRRALDFIARGEAGLLPEFPRAIYPRGVRFDWDGRDGGSRLKIIGPSDVRRVYRDFIHEHLDELKDILRARYHARRSAASAARASAAEERVSRSESAPAPTQHDCASGPDVPVAPNPDPEPEPDVRVQDYRLTEDDVKAMLASFGDDELLAYESGRLSRRAAYLQARRFYSDSLRLGLQVAIRGSSGRVFLYPQLRILRPPTSPPTKGNPNAR